MTRVIHALRLVIQNHMCFTLLFNTHFLCPQGEDIGAKFTKIQFMLTIILLSFSKAMSNKDDRVPHFI